MYFPCECCRNAVLWFLPWAVLLWCVYGTPTLQSAVQSAFALTVYATVVPQYFRICDLYLKFRKLWHHTIRACTDLYRWLRHWNIRYTVRVTSTVYAIVS